MATKKKVIIAGGTGFLGRLLIEQLSEVYDFHVLGRAKSVEGISSYQPYPEDPLALVPQLESCHALINLAGRSVNCRYTEKNKAEILQSRVATTAYLAQAIEACEKGPEVWMNMSSATIYPDSQEAQSESSPITESNFSVDVCRAWENTFNRAMTPAIRKITLRTGLVLHNEGGAFEMFRKLGHFGLGGTMGSGKQYINWLHAEDFVRAIRHFLENRSMGVYNLCAPQPATNAGFLTFMRQKFGFHLITHQKEWMIKMGAFLLGTSPELVLKSRRVIPERLLNDGFEFSYAEAEGALQALADDYFQSAENVSRSLSTGNFSLPSFKSSSESSA